MIGDAAGFVSPLSGEGIYYAMDSGRIVANAIIHGLKKHEKANHIFRRYQKKCMDSWGRNLLLLKYLRSMLLLKPDVILMKARHNIELQTIFGNLFKGSANPMKNTIDIPWLLTKELFTKQGR